MLWQISLFQRSKANHNSFCSLVSSLRLWQISLFQRSKANHNSCRCRPLCTLVVANIIISKIESKSQLNSFDSIGTLCCGKYHYFKDRKQITTLTQKKPSQFQLWQISLFQRSKANHNGLTGMVDLSKVVANIIISKIESKSQRFRYFQL